MLNKFNLVFQLLFAPEDAATGGNLNADSILDLLNEPDEDTGDELDLDNAKPAKKDDKKSEKTEVGEEDEDDDDKKDEKDEEDEDELAELEDELDEDEKDEDELELIAPVKRREILKEYPDLFKKFPYLEKAYYREQKFSEIYPSIADAQSAFEDAQTLKSFEGKILEGDISNIFSVVKTDNVESYNKLVDNLLPTLQKLDPNAFQSVVNSVIKPVIYHMATEGAREKDEDLSQAALVLNKYFFNSTKWEPHKPLGKNNGTSEKPNEEEIKLKAERESLHNERYTDARNDLSTRVESTFKKAIEKHIDPKGDMTPYVKKTAIREAYETLSTSLSKDTRFKSVLDKAWKKASEKSFSKDSVENIRRIINARAQTVLPTVIKKARTEAMRGMGKRVKADNDTEETTTGRSATSNNRGPLKQRSENSSGKNTKQSEIPKGMSNKDFIMSD